MIAAAPFILQNLSAVLLLIVSVLVVVLISVLVSVLVVVVLASVLVVIILISVLVVVLITVFLIAHGKSAFRVFLQAVRLARSIITQKALNIHAIIPQRIIPQISGIIIARIVQRRLPVSFFIVRQVVAHG